MGKGRGGYTLLEIVIVLFVGTVLLTAATQAVQSSQNTTIEQTVVAVADDTARRAIDRITEELRFAQLDSLAPANPVDEPSIQYRVLTGWDAVGPLTGPVRQLAHNGLNLELDGQIIASGINGLLFTQVGNAIRVDITLTRQVTTSGVMRAINRVISTDIEILN
ncbi:MAG: type II secretion system protein J [Planctomycetota bacterium]